MTKFNSVVAAAAILLSGSAWAVSSLQPAAGQAPLFIDTPAVTGAAQGQSVQVDGARQMPALGEMSARVTPAVTPTRTRAQVREALGQAIVRGFHIQAGDRS